MLLLILTTFGIVSIFLNFISVAIVQLINVSAVLFLPDNFWHCQIVSYIFE